MQYYFKGVVGCPRLALKYGYQNKKLHISSDRWPQILTKQLSIDTRSREQKVGPSLDNIYFWIPNNLAFHFYQADSMS